MKTVVPVISIMSDNSEVSKAKPRPTRKKSVGFKPPMELATVAPTPTPKEEELQPASEQTEHGEVDKEVNDAVAAEVEEEEAAGLERRPPTPPGARHKKSDLKLDV